MNAAAANSALPATFNPALAALLWDLHAAGVREEIGESPAGLNPPRTAVTAAASAATPVAVSKAMPAATVPVLGSRIAEVWQLGQPGGLLVVAHTGLERRGQPPLAGEELELLHNMLRALGLPAAVDGWVALGSAAEQPVPSLQAPLAAAVTGLQPRRVLVLGGAVAGTWLGRACGVENCPPEALAGLYPAAPVGLTYAPRLLLGQPVFKRLAWQHLLAWRARWPAAEAN